MDEVIATAGGCCVCKLLCGGGAVGVLCVWVVVWGWCSDGGCCVCKSNWKSNGDAVMDEVILQLVGNVRLAVLQVLQVTDKAAGVLWRCSTIWW